jgi:predicted MFS family arabinose efflux permease
MSRPFSGLWRNPDYMKLWLGQTISGFGSRITREALPLTAVLMLAGSPAQMGLLTAIGSLPALAFGLLAGAWVDRLPRRPILIVTDIGRMVLLISIPLAALAGRLSVELLLVVTMLNAALTIFFEVAYRAFLPSLVERDQLLEGNSKLATTESLAEIGGPPLAGLLVQLISAPLAIFFDAVSFLFSAISLALIRKRGVPAVRQVQRQSIWQEIAEGLRVVALHPILRTVALWMAGRSFFGSFFGALYALYAIRDLGLSPALLGLVVGTGGIGALLGALAAQWAPRRFGLGRSLAGALLCSALINLTIPLAGGPAWFAAATLIAGQIIGDAAMVIFLINEMSLRQSIVPGELLGRANASIGFLAQGAAPLGALVAGELAYGIGARGTLLVAVLES